MQKDLKDPGSTRFGTVADAMDHKGDIVWILYNYNYIYIYWLLVWNMNFIFPYILGIIIPTDFHMFQG